METWPESVPYVPLARTLQVDPFEEPYITEFEDGPLRSRPRGSMSIATLRFTIRMSNAEFDMFKTWVKTDLVKGTRRFSMPVWTGGAFATKACRFRERYKDDPGHGLRHRVAIVVDVEDW